MKCGRGVTEKKEQNHFKLFTFLVCTTSSNDVRWLTRAFIRSVVAVVAVVVVIVIFCLAMSHLSNEHL